MKTLNNTQLIVGIFAGVAAAFLSLGATVPSAMSFFLYAATPLPIFIVGLGWGNRAAIVAIVTTIILTMVALAPQSALMIAIFALLPAGWLSHLANLARPASEIGGPADMLAWYPLSNILLHLCAIVSAAFILLGIFIGYGPELVSTLVDVMLSGSSSLNSVVLPEGVSPDQLKAALLTMLPIVHSGISVFLLFATYYCASRIAQATGKSLRPREDMRAALRMHRNSIFIFMIAITATFFGGVIAIIGAVICGTFGAGFLLAGYATLHHRLKDKDWRVPVLILAYLAGAFILPLFIIVVFGMSDVRGTISLTSSGKNDDNNPTHH